MPEIDDTPSFENRYELKEKLGVGGVGTVYKAYNTKLAKTVAIKLLLPGRSNQATVRFHQEARATARLSHENIVRILDFGETAEKQLFLVMDFVKGESLAARLKREGRLPLTTARAIFIQLCKGLGHAHGHDILHRDVKPSNIMLTTDENGQTLVKIVDFGLAKLEAEDQQITAPGMKMGSPLYMSPEQASGKPVDRRSDLYSIGCLMVKTLTGAPPFVRETYMDTINCHASEPPPLLSDRLESELVDSGQLEDFEEIVSRLLAKNPDDRYDTVDELLEALQSIREPALASTITGIFMDYATPDTDLKISRRNLLLNMTYLLAILGVITYFSYRTFHSQTSTSDPLAKRIEFVGKDKFWKTCLVIPPSVDGSDLEALSKHEGIPRLVSLNPELSDSDMGYISRLPLEELDLSNTSVSSAGLKEVGKMRRLKKLVLDGCDNIDDTAVKQLAPLKNLQVLSIRSARISDLAVKTLAANNSNLICLDLSNNADITGNVITSIKEMDKLIYVALSSLGLTDDDIEPLFNLGLRGVNLSGNNITNRGLFGLVMMINSIEFVDVSKCPEVSKPGWNYARNLKANRAFINSDFQPADATRYKKYFYDPEFYTLGWKRYENAFQRRLLSNLASKETGQHQLHKTRPEAAPTNKIDIFDEKPD